MIGVTTMAMNDITATGPATIAEMINLGDDDDE